MLSDRYLRESAKAAFKVFNGKAWELFLIEYYGATIVHKRVPFADGALEGRSVTINFKPDHNRTYQEFNESDPVIVEWKKRLAEFVFKPPQLQRKFKGAGRILASFQPILALAELCGDTEFLEQVQDSIANRTDQLKEDQSIEPDGLVVRGLVNQLSASGGIVVHNVKIKDLRASIFANEGVDFQSRQIAGLCRELGFETKNSHGHRVVVPTAKLLVIACERVGYEDEEITKLKKHLQDIDTKP